MTDNWREQIDPDISWKGLVQSFVIVAAFLLVDYVMVHAILSYRVPITGTLSLFYLIVQGFLLDRNIGSLMFLLIVAAAAAQRHYHLEQSVSGRLAAVLVIILAPVIGYLLSRLLRWATNRVRDGATIQP